MPPHPRPQSVLVAWCAALAALAAMALPNSVAAHGGSTLAEGQKNGVTVLVQGSETTTPGGKPATDLATTLAGPGSGAGSTVVYYVRPEGGKSFRVRTDRDASGVHHADVAVAGRGDWRAWDVSAIVTLNGGKRLRVTNAASNPPGPDPAQSSRPKADAQDAPEASTPESASTPQAPGASTPGGDATASSADQDGAGLDDISGEQDSAPSWVLPSLVGLVVVGLGGLLVARRRGRDDDAEDDED